MAEDSTAAPAAARPLLPELFALLAAHRPAFRQDRPFGRCAALVLGWVCAFGRHTVTQVLVALGLGGADWTGFYRLFARRRFDYDRLSACLLGGTLPLAPAEAPYLVAVDATQVARRSRTMPGTSWLKHPGTPVFRAGIHRAQRFVHLAWLPAPSAAGYSRAVPLRLEAAFPEKAVAARDHPPRKEWEAGLAALGWARAELDAAGRAEQRLLALGDGAYANRQTWAGLPERVDLLARCPRNRALYALPPAYAGKGRPRLYGARAPRPDAWLAERAGWARAELAVRGRSIPLTYRAEGPYLVRRAPEQPVFLLVVKGVDRRARGRRREPTYWLVDAVADGAGGWRLPWPAEDLLAWAWQRWEVEVAHRELKTGFGLGEPQCWGPRSAVVSVQWAAWAYAVVVLAGVRAWGLGRGPVAPPGRWWGGGGRWSLGRRWQGLRAELWGEAEFRPVRAGTGGDWWETADWLAAKTNAALAASRT
jgi:hypothetical protein